MGGLYQAKKDHKVISKYVDLPGGDTPGERRAGMDIEKIAKELLEKSHLTKEDYFNGIVFFYLSGRYPDLTIRQSTDIVEFAREKLL